MGRRTELQRICKNFSAQASSGHKHWQQEKDESKVQKRYSGQFLVFHHQANFQLVIIGKFFKTIVKKQYSDNKKRV